MSPLEIAGTGCAHHRAAATSPQYLPVQKAEKSTVLLLDIFYFEQRIFIFIFTL